MALLISFLPRILAVLAFVAVLWTVWYRVNHWCNAACGEAEIRAEAAETLIAAAHQRATDLALLWAKSIEQVEVRYVEVVKTRTVTVERIREVAGTIRSATDAVPVPVPDSARRLLGDAERLANDSPASGVDQGLAEAVPEAADSTLTDWVAFAVDAAEAYRDASDKHLACVAWANSITEAKP